MLGLAAVGAVTDVEPTGLEGRAVTRAGEFAISILGRDPRLDVVLAGSARPEITGGDVDDPVCEAEVLQHPFLHLDEAQDFSRHNNRADQQAVISTLKSLMQSPEWPVGLILSGMPELLDLVNMDPQLARRLKPIAHRSLSVSVDGPMLLSALRQYASVAGITVDDELAQTRFIKRLIHAADHCFGILVELICEAIGEALLSNADRLSVRSFATCFGKRAGVPDGLNPFIAEDFRALDVRRLLQTEPGPGPKAGRR